MGQHKRNPVAIAAKEGKLNPKPRGIGRKEMQRLLYAQAMKACSLRIPCKGENDSGT